MTAIDFLRAQAENQFAAGAITGVLLGALLAALRNVPRLLGNAGARLLSVRVDVADHDPAFYWLQTWLAGLPSAQRARVLSATTRAGPGEQSDQLASELRLAPAAGWHLIWHRRWPLLLHRDRRDGEGTMGELAYRETMTLVAPTRAIAIGAIQAAARAACPESGASMAIHRRVGWSWYPVQRVRPRPLATVVLPEGMAEDLLHDARGWMEDEERYHALGVPWRRGYLFSGPPGTGKTSLAAALAGELGLDLYMVPLGSLGDRALANALDEAPARCLLLIEDVDAAGVSRDENAGTENDPLTLAGLLNALDGVASKQGRLLVMTTNRPEVLDAAMVRPGRADRHLRLGPLDEEQAARMYRLHFPDTPEAEACCFAGLHTGCTAAEAQAALLLAGEAFRRGERSA